MASDRLGWAAARFRRLARETHGRNASTGRNA
jgi:hypothetical protein